MAVVTRHEVLRVRAPVHVDDAEGVRTAFVEDENLLELPYLDELNAVRRQKLSSDARWMTPRMRLQLVALTILVQRLRPRLERDLLEFEDGIRGPEKRRP